MKAAIIGLAGPALAADEVTLLRATPPAGIILFARNIPGAASLARLVGDLREILPRETLLLVDQEGGRVARLAPPDWRAYPPAAAIAAHYAHAPQQARRRAWLTGALIGMDCKDAGFDVVCAPVLDVLAPGATDAIGDRSYGPDPATVAILGQAMADGLLAAGVQPVGKHAPGHGQAKLDTHLALPHLPPGADLAPDISVFQACSGLPWLMTAHIIYEALDPARPATLSPVVIEGVIRGAIGFDGVLVSDDLAMGALATGALATGALATGALATGALKGEPGALATAALAAGCDLAMHCSGRLPDTRAVLRAVPGISPAATRRLARARRDAEESFLNLDRTTLDKEWAALAPC